MGGQRGLMEDLDSEVEDCDCFCLLRMLLMLLVMEEGSLRITCRTR